MSERFDIAEYIKEAVAGVQEFLGGVSREDVWREGVPTSGLDWPPPRPDRGTDRERLEAATRFYAFEVARLKLRSPRERARYFLQLVAVSERAALHGISRAAALGGSSEAEGKRDYKMRKVLEAIEDGLARKLPLAEVFARAGVSQATGYRYLRRTTART